LRGTISRGSFAHRSVSAAMNFANTAGSPPFGASADSDGYVLHAVAADADGLAFLPPAPERFGRDARA